MLYVRFSPTRPGQWEAHTMGKVADITISDSQVTGTTHSIKLEELAAVRAFIDRRSELHARPEAA